VILANRGNQNNVVAGCDILRELAR
jgi:hypothetical protein